MGNIRTPKNVNFNGGVVEFYVKNKIICYRTLIWTRDGLLQFEFERGIYSEHVLIPDIIDRALQSFSEVKEQ